jgi:hypothetical protein
VIDDGVVVTSAALASIERCSGIHIRPILV